MKQYAMLFNRNLQGDKMYNDVLVSIIIPVYNIELYLRRCVDSVCRQTHRNLEIILINDGSTDNSPALCEQLAHEDDRIVVIHQENRGPGAARNAGLDAANGEWLCFVDGDDFISARYVELLLHAALDNECLTAQCKCKKGAGGSLEEVSFEPEVRIMDWRSFLFLCNTDSGHSRFVVWLNIYHSSIFSGIRFPVRRYSEETAVIPQIYWAAREKRIAAVDCELYYYFQRIDSAVHVKYRKTTLEMLDHCLAKKQAASFWEERGEYDLFDMYWEHYFYILVNEYIYLCRDLPQLREKYKHLQDEILKNIGKAGRRCLYFLTVPTGADGVWASLASENKQLVMYGYGEIGMKVLPWIEYFKLTLIEIWDRRAEEGETMEGIPIRPAHSDLSKDITIIVTIADPYVALTVQHTLRGMGYKNFVRWPVFEASLKYAQYKEFLPFLLEDKA
jgi:glycosyltransferase involved in cell wall biosynthesis